MAKDNFFPDDINEAAAKMGSDWIKGAEFDGKGLVLQLAKTLEKVKANNPEYGAQEDDYLVKGEILEVGQSLRFTFKDAEGNERKFDTSSTPFFIGFKQCEDLGVGDWVLITRTGKTNKTRYTVVKTEAPAAPEPKPEPVKAPEDEVNPDDIPF